MSKHPKQCLCQGCRAARHKVARLITDERLWTLEDPEADKASVEAWLEGNESVPWIWRGCFDAEAAIQCARLGWRELRGITEPRP